MAKACFRFAALGLLLLLSGCWDIKSLQDVNYFTGMGIDYANGQYDLYIQQLDFANVAKTEGGKGDTPATVWVGHAKGASISDAVIELYRTTQQTVFWGHLNTILLSENMLKNGDLMGVIDSLIRFPEIRYTPWVFGTTKSMTDLFTTRPFFNLSPMNSILYAPETNFSQRPRIAPKRLSAFIREIREPGKTALLPSLSYSDGTWTRNRKPDPKLEIDGVFAMRNLRYLSRLESDQLAGSRWVTHLKQGTRNVLREGGETVATIRFGKPRTKVHATIVGGEPRFDIEVRVNAAIIELWKMKTEKQFEKLAASQIEDQIRETFRNAVEQGIDVLDLEHRFYRRHYREWNKLTSGGRVPLKPLKLGSVKASVTIVQTGMYQMKRKMEPY